MNSIHSKITSSDGKSMVSSKEWNDWQWQLSNRITKITELEKYINLTKLERKGIDSAGTNFRWAITPYYASLMDKSDPSCPLRIQQIPSIQELLDKSGLPDPLSEKDNSPVDSIVHVYPDRVAFKITNICPTYCRYCFREYFVGNINEHHTRGKIQEGLEYIRQKPEIRDVLVTGGDPLLFSDNRLAKLLGEIRAIKHVEIIRLGTRTLCTLPQRITKNLCSILEKYHPIWLNTHFNHPNELTHEAHEACSLLLKHGVPIGNQTVLLKGVNDSIKIMKRLVHGLLKMRVRPYYIFQCQLLEGTSHLRTSIEKGLEILKYLQGYTTGFGVPEYVLDTPYGKVPLSQNHILGRINDQVVVKTYNGKIWRELNPLEKPNPVVKLPEYDSNHFFDGDNSSSYIL